MLRSLSGYSLIGPGPQNNHVQRLVIKAQKLLQNGLAKSSRSTYAAGGKRFLNFCKAVKLRPIPASERALTLFSTHLAMSNVSYGTIKVYLSAIRHMHICKGLHANFRQQLTPRLHLILRGIKKRQAGLRPKRKRLPITISLLRKIRHLLAKQPSYDSTTLWAMCCLAFFGFMRVSEFTIPREGSYAPSRHLSLEDVAVDNRTKPRLIQVFLKQSKTDPFRQGAKVYLGATGTTVCPVNALLAYLARRNRSPGPLFVTQERKGWTKSMFRTALQRLLKKLKLNKKHYNTHSFRIGAATTASLANITDTNIQKLGRWRSNAFRQYIRPPPNELAKLSRSLVRRID